MLEKNQNIYMIFFCHLGDEELITMLIKSKICGAELKKTRQPHALQQAAELGKF